jgi:hypothetical protein
VVYKGMMKLLEAQDCTQCFHRFELDTYGRGCVHNCAYCYAKSYLSIRRYWNEPMPFPVDIAAIRKIFATVFETSKPSKFRAMLERRVPLRLGSMSDAFMWMDKKYRVTLELLKILRFYRYPYLIFTRSDLVADEEYRQAMDPHLASIQMSLSSINRELTPSWSLARQPRASGCRRCRPWWSTASGPQYALIHSSRFILTGTTRTPTLIMPNLSGPSTFFPGRCWR